MTELDASYDPADGVRQPHLWGFEDTRFEFDGPRSLRMTGSRYPLAGHSMPDLVPFAESVLGVSFGEDDRVEVAIDTDIDPPVLDGSLRAAFEERLGPSQVSVSNEDRLLHSHGQVSVGEIYRLVRGGRLERVVDLVVYPESEDDVRATIELAAENGACLVPYGGGTNVSGALACPATERRTVISVDMSRMNRILWIDEENDLASIEAGISGKELERELAARGYTSGHDPDSVELSTLGGWIATNASGMKKNRYGNIEDIVLEATLVTPRGDVTTRHATPRNSAGVQPRAFLFGSEGNLGIITRALLKVHRLPERREYGSLVFPSMEHGVRFLRDLRRVGVLPASIRLVDNNEFRFGQALKPAAVFPHSLVRKLQKWFLFRVRGFDPSKMAACTVLMEGLLAEVGQQRRTIFPLARRHGGVSGGAANGKRGYMLTFAIAYIRDLFNQFDIVGETFETSVPWDRIHHVAGAVREKLAEECERHGVAGRPYLSHRVTQTYHTGVCIYFTMGMAGRGLADPERVYHEIEAGLRQVILDQGGSLSHHHGVGKLRARFLPQYQTEASMELLRDAKASIDPTNVFGVGNGVFAPELRPDAVAVTSEDP